MCRPLPVGCLFFALVFVVLANAPLALADTQDQPDKQADSRTDLYGDPLPPGVLSRLGTVRFRHPILYSTCGPLVFTPDGKRLVSASDADRKVRVWDVATGKQLRERRLEPVHERFWPRMVLSADGSTLAAAAAYKGVYVWKVFGDQAPYRVPGDTNGMTALALSGDGSLLAMAGLQRKIRLLDLASEKERTIDVEMFVNDLLLSQDGKRLAVAWSEELRVYDSRSAKELHRFARDNNTGSSQVFAFSPDGQGLAVCERGKRNVVGGRVVGRVDTKTVLWDLGSGRELGNIEAATSAGVFSPDGKTLATPSGDGIRLSNGRTGEALRLLSGRSGYTLAFSPDGKTLAFRQGSAIHLWNLDTDKVFSKTEGHRGGVMRVAFSPDGKQMASVSENIRVWETASGRPIRVLEAGQEYPFILTFVRGGQLLVSGRQHEPVLRWDMTTGKQLPPFDAVELKSKGKEHRLSSDGTVVLAVMPQVGEEAAATKGWDLASGNALFKRDGAVAFPELLSRNGKIRYSASLEELLRRPNVPGRKIAATEAQPRAVFSPDGRMMAVTRHYGFSFRVQSLKLQPPGLDILETATGLRIARLNISPSFRIAFSPTGRQVAVAGLDTLHLFDLPSGKEVLRRAAPESFQSYAGIEFFASCMEFAPDSNTLATGLPDGTTLLWDVSPPVWDKKPAADKPKASDLERLWSDLAADDATKAYAAIWALSDTPVASLPYLKRQLRPTAALEPERVQRWIGELDSKRFAERDTAYRELRALGERVEPLLKKAIEQKSTEEFRRRAESLLASLRAAPPSEVLRRIRAIQVLESLGTPEASDVLRTMAAGAPEARETWEAQDALERLRWRAESANVFRR